MSTPPTLSWGTYGTLYLITLYDSLELSVGNGAVERVPQTRYNRINVSK